MTNAYLITKDSLSLIVEGKPHVVANSHPKYSELVQAIKQQNWETVISLFDIKKVIYNFVSVHPEIEIDLDQNVLQYKGNIVSGYIISKIFEMIREGFEMTPMLNFLSNLYQNPSQKSIQELYQFLEFGKMPITEDGHFVAYKKVRHNYTSEWDKKTDNSIGKVVEMPRDGVDDDSNNTCSTGLHFCSFDYLKHYSGDRVMILKVNPKDVVSIPTDYNNTKARCCRYEVIGELDPSILLVDTHTFNTPVYTNDHYQHDIFEDEDPHEIDNFFEEEELSEMKKAVLQQNQNQDQQTGWYIRSYNVGYKLGRTKQPMPPDATLFDSNVPSDMTQHDIDDINAGFVAGYKDGKAHKARRF